MEINEKIVTTPEGTKIDLCAFVNEVYDLDEKVYEETGSGLGRVFNSGRDRSIRAMVRSILHGQQHIVRTEVALIGNMARTIKDEDRKQSIMAQYDSVMERLIQLGSYEGNNGLLDDADSTHHDYTFNLLNRFSGSEHIVLCLSRTYGSGGTSIGFGLADALHIDYYDAEIFTRVLARLGTNPGEVTDEASIANLQNARGANPALTYKKEGLTWRDRLKRVYRFHGLPARDAIFFNESDLIRDLAKERDFLVMGRCADVILTNEDIPHVSIFITAPEEQRIKRIMQMNEVGFREAKRQIRETDRSHASYYQYFTGRKWGEAGNYDICINSAAYGIQGTIDFILDILHDAGITAASPRAARPRQDISIHP